MRTPTSSPQGLLVRDRCADDPINALMPRQTCAHKAHGGLDTFDAAHRWSAFSWKAGCFNAQVGRKGTTMKNAMLVKLAVVAAVLLSATAAQAQMARPSLSSQIKMARDLTTFVTNGRTNGYRRIAELHDVIYDDDRADRVSTSGPSIDFLTVHLERGVTYRIGARGDDDAAALSVRLVKNDNDEEVKSTPVPTRRPALSFRPKETGDYTVVIEWVENPNGARRTQVGAAVLAK
jgi:hypothetical protein